MNSANQETVTQKEIPKWAINEITPKSPAPESIGWVFKRTELDVEFVKQSGVIGPVICFMIKN